MSTMVFQTNKSINEYGLGIRKLLLDIKEEIENGTKDGIGMQLASQSGDETSVYNFIKNQGYDVTYKDFLIFHKDSKKIVEDNGETIKSLIEEQKSEELSDSDLEQVAGGLNWWQWILVGIGAALVIAAVTILTCGIGTGVVAAMSGASMGFAAMSVAIPAAYAGAATAGFIAAVVGGVGAGAVATGLLT